MNKNELRKEVEGAVNEADTYMAEHRVTESWRVINRLRDTLVRLNDSIQEDRS